MTQKEIIYANGEYLLPCKWPYKSLGMVTFYLRLYGYLYYDRVTVSYSNGLGTVNFYDAVEATYTWNDEIQMPIFKFVAKYDWLNIHQDTFVEKAREQLVQK